MGYYGAEKPFQMARSILPSTAREMARQRKRQLQHKNRNEIRQKLCRFRGRASDIIEEYDDYREDLNHCWTPRYMMEWDVIVFDRRASDKLNHFCRWAKAITDHLPQEEKMDFIRPMLPVGLIGEHARSHLYELEPDQGYRSWMPTDEELAEREAKIKARRKAIVDYNEAMRKALWKVATSRSGRRKLNEALYHRTHPHQTHWQWHNEDGVVWLEKIKGNGIPLIQMNGKDGAKTLFDLVKVAPTGSDWRVGCRSIRDIWLAKFLCEYFAITYPLVGDDK